MQKDMLEVLLKGSSVYVLNSSVEKQHEKPDSREKYKDILNIFF